MDFTEKQVILIFVFVFALMFAAATSNLFELIVLILSIIGIIILVKTE